MSLKPLQPQRFDSDSAVAAYWYTRCDGFRVVSHGRDAGTVEQAVFDWDPLHPVALSVRRPRGRSRLVLLEEVEAVEPLSRIIYVRGRPARRAAAASQLRRGSTRAVAAARTSSKQAGSLIRSGTASAARFAVHHWPAVRHGLLVALEVVVTVFLVLTALVLSALGAAIRKLDEIARAAVARQRRQPAALPSPAPSEAETTSFEAL